MSKRAAVPVVNSGVTSVDKFAAIVKQNSDWLTGQSQNSPDIVPLASTATLSEVVTQVNKMLVRIQGT
ncbi:MAG: hypothetical protein ACK5A0_04675 [Polaromonas sp.]|jgi:hypothetical protein